MAVTAAALLTEDHATALTEALPGKRMAALADLGTDRAVRVTSRARGAVKGMWEVVAVTSSVTWVWWMPEQKIDAAAPEGTLMASVDASLHFAHEWADRVACAIEEAAPKIGHWWEWPL